MDSLYQEKVGGKTYWYLREMARAEGKPTWSLNVFWTTPRPNRSAPDAHPNQPEPTNYA
jgi:hypothetical protein